MYAKGHSGLTLGIVSLLMLPFGWNENALIVIAIATGLSALPDIDLKWMRYSVSIKGKDYRVKHRGKVTHSIFFAILIGLLLGGFLFYGTGEILFFGIGFAGALMGIVTHLLGDTFTYHAFPALWPLSPKPYSRGFCGAGNKAANEGLMIFGTVVFAIYFSITSGILSEIIPIFFG